MPRAPPTWAAATTPPPHPALQFILLYHIISYAIYFTISFYNVFYYIILYHIISYAIIRSAACTPHESSSDAYLTAPCIILRYVALRCIYTRATLRHDYDALAPCGGSYSFYDYQMNTILIGCIIILWTRSMTRWCQNVCIVNRAPPWKRRRWPAPPSA